MATELQRLSKRVSDDFLGVARRVTGGSLFVKIALLGIGSAVAAIAQFVQFAPSGPTAWQIAGILASLIVLIGGGFVA